MEEPAIFEIIENVFPGELLNKLIQNEYEDFRRLTILLKVKQDRILKGKEDKISLLLLEIIKKLDNDNVNQICSVTERALNIIENPQPEIEKILYYINNQLNEHPQEFIKILNILIIFCYSTYLGIDFSNYINFENLSKLIVSILKGNSKTLKTFILAEFLPNLLQLTITESNIFVQDLFTFVKESYKLEILCSLHQYFINLFESHEFSLILQNSITSKDNFLQKQAIFLLKICIKHNISFTKLSTDIELESDSVWNNFFLLIDCSKEKQIHLIKPSLHFLDAIGPLQLIWKNCLYKLLLNHSQNSVVYLVVLKVLQDKELFLSMKETVLNAVNKHDYCKALTEIFQTLTKLCSEMTKDEFNSLLQCSLDISWNTSGIWGFSRSVFHKELNYPIDTSLLHPLFIKLTTIPDKYIRLGCLEVFFSYFQRNFVLDNVNNLSTISKIFIQDDVHENDFIISNQDFLLNQLNYIEHELNVSCSSSYLNTPYIKLLCNILVTLKKVDILKDIFLKVGKNSAKDLLLYYLTGQLSSDTITVYLLDRLQSVKCDEDTSFVISVISKITLKSAIFQKAMEILNNDDPLQNKAKVHIAFHISTKHQFCNFNIEILTKWRDIILQNNNKIRDEIIENILELFFSKADIDESEFLEFLDFLEMVLNTNDKSVNVIFKNLNKIIQLSETSDSIHCFLNKCLNLLVQNDGNNFLIENVKPIFNQLLSADCLNNPKFNADVINICCKFIELPKFKNVAAIFSETLLNYAHNYTTDSSLIIPLITKLIFYGIIINKNQRTYYYIYREIYQDLGMNDVKPTFDMASTKIAALKVAITLSKIDNVFASKLTSDLIKKFKEYSGKRYFPNSKIHLEMVRILQTVILLESFLYTERLDLIAIFSESLLMESHQPSVKHLIQLLLIRLINNEKYSFEMLRGDLQFTNSTRPISIICFIPIIYHLTRLKPEEEWHQIFDFLISHTIGAQFKLRTYAQIALVKLYVFAIENNFTEFINKYGFFCETAKSVLESNKGPLCQLETVEDDFLDYLDIEEDMIFPYILIVLPARTGVTAIEFEYIIDTNETYKNLPLKISPSEIQNNSTIDDITDYSDNIQKKITPWKEVLENCSQSVGDFILITSLVEKSANLGGLARTCEVFGVKQLIMRTSKIVSDKEFKNLSMSSENWLNITEVKYDELKDFIVGIKEKGYCIIGAEQTSDSIKLNNFKFQKKIVLLLGNEKEGIPPDLIPLLDFCIEIPQFGVVRSLNVHVAGAIIIWEYCKQCLLNA